MLFRNSYFLTWIRSRSMGSQTRRRMLKEMLKEMCRAALVLVALLIVAACTPQEATVRLKDEIPVDSAEIIHARFPCRSPDLHFFGYRFRVYLNKETGDGNICWDLLSRKWTWYILPEYKLSRLNVRK